MEFHECLVKLMKEKNVSQARICKATGIASSAMSHYVRGETEPSFTKVVAIARALGVATDALAGKQPKMSVDTVEAELLALYRSMDSDGRERLMEQAQFLASRHRGA